MNWGSAGLSSARKGFLLTDALAAVFVVFLLCGIVSAVLTGYLNTQQTIRQAAEKIEKEAMQAFAEGEKELDMFKGLTPLVQWLLKHL